MKTLVQICVEQLKKRCLGKVETLQVLELANELDMRDLREDCLRSIRFAYDFFREVTDEGYLRELCGEVEVDYQEKQYHDRIRRRRSLRQEGTILESASTEYSDQQVTITRVDGDEEPQYFPYDALVMGVKWPLGIDPTKREEYLSEFDFEKLFKMTKDQFRALPKFNRERRKKELKLW